MTHHFTEAVALIGRLPEDQQDEAARLLRAFAGIEEPAEAIDPAHLAGVMSGLKQIRSGQRATDDEVEAAFRRFGP